jgi:hypothetical protein
MSAFNKTLDTKKPLSSGINIKEHVWVTNPQRGRQYHINCILSIFDVLYPMTEVRPQPLGIRA